MSQRLGLTFCFLLLTCTPWQPGSGAQAQHMASSSCLSCHFAKQSGLSAAHAFAASSCVTCHAGNNASFFQDDAHKGLIAFPGDLENAQQTCGGCHAERVASVTNNLMHTARGMVHVTRQALGEAVQSDHADDLQSLGHGVADSMLRKQCASCHIGQTKTGHRHDVMWDRGGGCLACHVNDYPENAHPALTARVSDARCFGCHSRSGRISLSYTGLAEVDAGTLKLPDSRPIERMPADVHYQAGMSCIDCHTSVGLMGNAGDALHQRQAMSISPAWIAMKNPKPNLTTAEEQHSIEPTLKCETTLPGCTPRTTDRVLQIPVADPAYHDQDENHNRLTCASLATASGRRNAFGCHMEYDADGEQWDHVERAITPGRWSDQALACAKRASQPSASMKDNQIELFVPGMIMTVAHPDLEEEKFVRMFASLSPHTIGKSRSCAVVSPFQ